MNAIKREYSNQLQAKSSWFGGAGAAEQHSKH